jgi:hypothetical protein
MCVWHLDYVFFVAKEKFSNCTIIHVVNCAHKSMLAGIVEVVKCPAASHMARVHFHTGALSCIRSGFLELKLLEHETDHSPLTLRSGMHKALASCPLHKSGRVVLTRGVHDCVLTNSFHTF